MPYAKSGDIELYFERSGSGEPLLFISGTGSDLRSKPNVFDGPLSKTFDVVSYDQRGLGRSSKPDRAYSMADYADDAAAIMDHVGWSSALVIGVSFGGMVAQELALRHPSNVRRMVLACTSPGGEGGSSYPFHDISHLSGEARARHLLPISDLRRDTAWAEANAEAHAAFIAFAAADPYGDEPGYRRGGERQIEARADHNVWDRLGEIACPVIIAAGAHDGIAPLATQHRMLERIPGASLKVFEGGHLFMLQDRRAVPAMVEFLKA